MRFAERFFSPLCTLTGLDLDVFVHCIDHAPRGSSNAADLGTV